MAAPHRHFAVTLLGCEAHRALTRAADGGVAAVLPRALYLAIGEDWLCLGPPGLGRGALNAICVLPEDLDWRSERITPDGPVAIRGDVIALAEGPTFTTSGAQVWSPPPPGAWSANSLVRGLAALPRLARPQIPAEGLGLFVERDARPVTPEARMAAPAIAAIEEALSCGRRFPASVRLLGLGPGLTPAGDDFLGGAMIALRLVERAELADGLWRDIARTPERTNGISFAHLRAAARGGGSAALHECLNALLAGDAAALERALGGLGVAGHSSPWDGLAGAATALRAWSRVEMREGVA